MIPAEAPAFYTHIVEGPVCTNAELEQKVRTTQAAHAAELQAFAETWYTCGHTWSFSHLAGQAVMKSPTDLWIYHDLLHRYRFECIIETGTAFGGSALWFAVLCDLLQLPNTHIWTIDLESRASFTHPRIGFLTGSSLDPAMRDLVRPAVRHPLLISLDSEHTEAHVRDELELWAPLCDVGDWLVVEDTNISWPEDGGARAGLQTFLAAHPGEWRQDATCERYLHTCHPGGWLQRMAR